MCLMYLEAPVSTIVDHHSISFGTYANDHLAREKRSVFTPNSRQEELEKCSARGLVSQKKAFFEEFFGNTQVPKASRANLPSEFTSECRGEESASKVSSEKDETVAEIKELGEGALETGEVLRKATSFNNIIQDAAINLHTSSSLSSIANSEDFEQRTEARNFGQDNCSLDSREAYGNSMDSASTNEFDETVQGASTYGMQFETPTSATPAGNIERDANSKNIKQHKKQCPSILKQKDSSYSTRRLSKMETKVTMSSHDPEPSSKKTSEPRCNAYIAKRSTNKHSSISISTSIVSSTSVRGQLKVTTPCPFLFATEIRAARRPCVIEDKPRLSNRLASSKKYAKEIMDKQGTSSKEPDAKAAKGRVVERPLDHSKHECGLPKKHQVKPFQSEAKEGNPSGSLRKSKNAAAELVGHVKEENEKIRNSQSNGPLLSGGKLRQNKPVWR